MDRAALLARLDEKAALDFLSAMARHKSYSETEGERVLAAFMADKMREIGIEAELQPVIGERVNAIGRLKGAGGGKSLPSTAISTPIRRPRAGRSIPGAGWSTTSSSTASASPT